jgi:integrase
LSSAPWTAPCGTRSGSAGRSRRASLARVARARRDLGEDVLPDVHLHDLRHTHATIMLGDGRQPVKVVSERLGHASPMITMTVYQHVMPSMQREAASSFASMVLGGVQ